MQWSFSSLLNTATEKVPMKHITEMKILNFWSEKEKKFPKQKFKLDIFLKKAFPKLFTGKEGYSR